MAKKWDVMYKISIKKLKSREKKTDGLQDPKNNTAVNYLGFLFASYILDLELKKPLTQK